MWYKDWFKDSNYLVVYEHRDDREAEQMMDLISKTIGHDPSRRVLDVGCGSGRHSISLAKQGFTKVTGIDLSPTLLEEAKDAAAQAGVEVKFLQRDMRDIPEEEYDLAINLFTSFGYFADDSENEEVISSVAKRLVGDGHFVIDFFNSHYLRSHLVAHDERFLPGGKRLEQMRWIENGRVEKRMLIRSGEEASEYIESVRLYELPDFERMFRNAGLRLTHVFGSYTGEEFNPAASSRLIMFARR
jgi:SAM-dependent methyltransferase